MTLTVILPWQIGEATGWGQAGLRLALALTRQGVTVETPHGIHPVVSYADRQFLVSPSVPAHGPRVMLQPLGNACIPRTVLSDTFGADHVVGWPMIESTDLSPQQLENLRTYDRLVTSSTWNAETFARHGLTVPLALQGIHTDLYRPARTQSVRRAPTDLFRIFSGGKFEYRKGHDLVIDTFRTFRQRFPHIPTTLVIAWHNVWPQTVGPLHHTGYLTSLPAVDPLTQRFDFSAWLATQGIAISDVEDVGYLPPDQLAPIVQNCDAGLFLSRAESANNQPLGECLSAGVPCVVSPSTGHRDYAPDDPLLLTLTQTTPTRFAPLPYRGLSGWIESDPFEAALALEAIASRPTLLADRSAFHAQWNWDTRAAHLLPLLRDVGA